MRTKSLLNHGLIAIGARLLAVALNLAISVLLSRAYGLEAVGIWALGAAIGMVAGYLGAFGLNASTTKLVASCIALHQAARLRRAVDLSLCASLFGVSILVAIFSWAIWQFGSGFVAHPNYFAFFCIFLGTSLGKASATSICALRGIRKSWQSVVLEVIPVPLLTILAFLIYVLIIDRPPNFESFSVIWLLASFSAVIWRRLYWQRSLSHVEDLGQSEPTTEAPYRLHELLKISWPFYIGSLVFMSINQVDTLLLGSLSTPEEVGGYSIAFRLASLLAIFQSVTDAFTTPRLAEHSAKRDHRRMVEVASKSSTYILAAALPATLFYILFGHSILSIWGDDASAYYLPLIVLTIGQLVNVGSGPSGRLLLYSDFGRLRNWIAGSALILDIILNYFLIQRYGALGAAWATTISIASMYTLFWLYSGLKLGHFVAPRVSYLVELAKRY